MEENPFPGLKVADFEFLSNLETREKCGRCGKSRMYYCYTCFTALPSLRDRMPYVKLPYKVHVIKHPGEVCGKSTAVHAAVLAPEDVTIYTYPDIPEYPANVRVALVFPGGNAVTVQEYVRSLKVAANEISCPVSERKNSVSSTENIVDTDNLHDLVQQNQVASIAIDPEISMYTKTSKADDPQDKIIPERCVEGGQQESHPEEPTERNSPASCGREELNKCDDTEEELMDFSCAKRLPETCSNGKAKLPHVPDISINRSQNLIDVVVFIDCTWFQVHKLSSDPRLSGLQRIELTLHDTKFWRPQRDKPSTYLSTIEAMYYCAREYHECCSDVSYDGQYDNLLFFFCFFYDKIKKVASKTGKKLKAYHQERRKKPKMS